MDRISNLPDSVVNLILERLDFFERVRTSALSRSWRYRWTYLSSLLLHNVFYESICEYIDGHPWKYANLVNSLLLQHGSCIREFTLYIPEDHLSHFWLFENAIRFVTRSSSIQTLGLDAEEFHDLSPLCSSIFSLVNLRELYLCNFQLSPPSWFKGFPNLTQLQLVSNIPPAHTVSHFISVCPQLQTVILDGVLFIDQVLKVEASKLRHLEVDGDFKGVALSNAPNLEYAKMWLVRDSDEEAANSVYMFDHFNSFAQVQRMLLSGEICKVLSHGETEAESEPVNVEWLVEKYINKDFRHLQRVELSGVRGTKTYMKVVEWLLRFSPILEVICIQFADNVNGEEKYQLVRAMINYRRASTKVKFEIS